MADIDISWEWGGLQELHAKLEHALEALEPDSLRSSVGEGADILVDAAKAGLNDQTFTLDKSIEKIPFGVNGWSIGPKGDVVYANIQDEGGTNFGNPYMYLPSGAKFISVDIPGQHYMDAARAESFEAVRVVVADVEYKIGF